MAMPYDPRPGDPSILDDRDRGPVMPLYLNRRETEILSLAVQITMSLDVEVLHQPPDQWPEALRELGQDEAFVAAAADRRPILMSLDTALREQLFSLGLGQDDRTGPPEEAGPG